LRKRMSQMGYQPATLVKEGVANFVPLVQSTTTFTHEHEQCNRGEPA